jgi:hypothetical protein
MVDLERENSVASSASDAPASCLAMILVRSWGVRWGFFLAFPLISVPNERCGGILGWVEDEVDARAIFVFALAFGYFLPSTVPRWLVPLQLLWEMIADYHGRIGAHDWVMKIMKTLRCGRHQGLSMVAT